MVEGENRGEENLIQPYKKNEWVSHGFSASRRCRSLSSATMDCSIGKRAVALCTDRECAAHRKTTITASFVCNGSTPMSALFFR
jgi:hypothetical protein